MSAQNLEEVFWNSWLHAPDAERDVMLVAYEGMLYEPIFTAEKLAQIFRENRPAETGPSPARELVPVATGNRALYGAALGD
jgi:hypothetical protein